MVDDLIRKAQAGDTNAFRALVEAFNAVAGRTARVLLSDRMAAEDAVQEAWIDAWRHLNRFETGRPFRPWILKLVANRCRMSARRRKAPTVTLDAIDSEMLNDGTDLQHDVLRSLRDAELQQTLATLTAKQQQVLALYYFADLDVAEIALVLDIRQGTVKSRLHHARATLRKRLEADIADALVAPAIVANKPSA